jgi:sugar phosphate permease
MLYSGSLLSGAFSGLIAAGITGNMDGVRGLGAWQWLFIIEGVVTIGIAFTSFFILPDFPRTTTWLTEEEKALAVWRLEEDIGEDDWIDSQHQTFWQGAKLAFEDTKTYVLMVLLFGCVASGSVTNFFPTVVKTLGYGNVTSLLLTTPPYVLCVITSFINAWHADKTGERYLHIILPLVVNMVANIIAATTTTLGPRYLSMMLMVCSLSPVFGAP